MKRLSKTVLAGSAILAGSGVVASSNGLTIVAHASQKSGNQSTSTNTDTTSSNDDASVEEKLKKLSNQGKPFVSKTALANRNGRVRVVVPVVKQKTITSKLSNDSDSSVQGESPDVRKESTNNVIISTSSPNLNTDKPATSSKPATSDKSAKPSNPTTSDKPATPNKSATADKLVSSSKSSTADKPALANRPTVKDESAKSTTTAPLSTSTSSNSNKSVDPVLSKKENVSVLTKGKSKTTEPTTDSVNGKHSEAKSADYNSSLPQTNNKSSLAGILAGSAMIATMST